MRFAPGGRRYAGIVGVTALPAIFVSPWASAALLGVATFILWFLRDPDREPTGRGALSPADGKVSVVREEGDRLRVGVFMNVLDVHVNRAPLGGTVEAIDHRDGAHRPAFSKDSDRNERVRIDFGDHIVVLIAGAFARRITPYVDVGDALDRGERLGHIAFGSRVDIVLPPTYGRGDLRIGPGDRVRAGETVIARR